MRYVYLDEPLPFVGARRAVWKVERQWSWQRLRWVETHQLLGYLDESAVAERGGAR